MNSLADAVDAVERRRKTLDVYVDDEAVAAELAAQFVTKNVRVGRSPIPSGADGGFVVVRNPDGTFAAALGIEQLAAVVSPTIHPPWTIEERVAAPDLFDFLDDTVFASYDRRQMLATAREIEERAWRADAGALYAGFQRAAAFEAQRHVYERFARETDVSVRVFVDDQWLRDEGAEPFEVVAEVDGELGLFWFVVFDGGEVELNACALLAEERTPGEFYGFWTYDPAAVRELTSYLEATYGEP